MNTAATPPPTASADALSPIPTRSSRTWLFGLGLMLATLIVYQPAWDGQPVFDDHDHLTPPELSSVSGLFQIWFKLGSVSQYYPITHTAFWIQHHLWGESMLGYHLVNILLHAFAALLVGRILQRLNVPGAWLAAAIFALHPVHAESVAWISELKNTLSGVFYLGAALVYLRFDASRQRNTYFIALGLFAAGLLAKSVIATLPAALLVVFWWRRGTLSWKRDVQPLLPFFALAVAAGLLTAWMERKFIGAEGEAFALTMIERFLVAGRVVWFYLGKLVWPAELIFIYPRWQISGSDARQYLLLAAAIGVLFALWALRRRWRGPLAALLFFGGTLFPVLGFLNVYPFVYSFVADHYQYLASLGIITAVAAGVATGLARGGVWGRPVGHAICAVLLVTLGALAWRQSQKYENTETLWRTTVAQNPECWTGYSNLGNYYLEQGNVDEAIRNCERALVIRPNLAEAHNNLGNALRQKGRPDEAMEHYQRARELRPDLAEVHYNIGVIFAQRGQAETALSSYEKAIELRPEFIKARNNLGSILLDQGRVDEAIAHIRKALEVRPDDEISLVNLGNAFIRQSRIDEAVALYERALRVDPENATAHHNLGSVLLQQGRIDEAAVHIQWVLQRQPESPQALSNLGNVYLQKQQLPQAVAQFEKSLRVRPDDPAVLNDLGSALLQLGRVEEGVAQLRKAVQLRPNHELAQFNLGYALLQQGQHEAAISCFEQAVSAQPNFALAHYQLGNARMQQGQLEAAIAHLQKATTLQPDFPNAFNDLGVALIQQGQVGEAVMCFERALATQPGFAEAHNNLGRVFAQSGRGREAVHHYKAALEAQKDNPETMANLAWVYATSADASVRNGAHAIFLAQRAAQLSAPHPFLLRTLAAAFAEAGRFGEAIATAERALELIDVNNDAALAEELRAHLKLYQTGTPFHERPNVAAQPVVAP